MKHLRVGLKAVRKEMGRQLQPRFDDLIAVTSNGVLMIMAWFLLPRAWLFSVTGPAAFPLILASWMYADSPATNALAADPTRSLRALRTGIGAGAEAHDGVAEVVRLLRAKRLVLWLTVSAPCVAAAVVTGVLDHRPLVTAATLIGILVLPLGPLQIAGCVGLLYPYHPRRLRSRWAQRGGWRKQLRWAVLVVTPFLIVPCLLTLTTLPSTVIWRLVGPPPPIAIPETELAALVMLGCAVCVALALIGAQLTRVIVRRRQPALVAFLTGTGQA